MTTPGGRNRSNWRSSLQNVLYCRSHGRHRPPVFPTFCGMVVGIQCVVPSSSFNGPSQITPIQGGSPGILHGTRSCGGQTASPEACVLQTYQRWTVGWRFSVWFDGFKQATCPEFFAGTRQTQQPHLPTHSSFRGSLGATVRTQPRVDTFIGPRLPGFPALLSRTSQTQRRQALAGVTSIGSWAPWVVVVVKKNPP